MPCLIAPAWPWYPPPSTLIIALYRPSVSVTRKGSRISAGVPAGTYSFFNNTPDERYPQFELNPTAGTTAVLFASDYSDNGSTHLLGFTHARPQWRGRVIAYQPGEYQPNALDDLAGNNFQILANAIYYARFHAQVELVFSDGFEDGN